MLAVRVYNLSVPSSVPCSVPYSFTPKIFLLSARSFTMASSNGTVKSSTTFETLHCNAPSVAEKYVY